MPGRILLRPPEKPAKKCGDQKQEAKKCGAEKKVSKCGDEKKTPPPAMKCGAGKCGSSK